MAGIELPSADHKDHMADHLSGMLRHYLEWELNVDPVTLLRPVHFTLTYIYIPHLHGQH
jgi:hypothetical protein